MRVIEQLIQHFWERGALSRADAKFLVEHHFARRDQFPASLWGPFTPPPPDELLRPPVVAPLDEVQLDLEGRERPSRKAGPKPGRRRARAERLAPLLTRLRSHVRERERYPALQELGHRLVPCTGWRDAATAIVTAERDDLQAALLRTLDARPRALAELWFWFDVEALFAWAASSPGAIAQAVARMLRAQSLYEAGRAAHLLKSPEVQSLAALHAARRHFLPLLPALHARAADLPRWLVPPRGPALASWPRLAWAFVIAYNAPYHRQGQAAPGVRPRRAAPDEALFRESLLLATRIDPAISLVALVNEPGIAESLTATMPPNWAV